AWASVVGAGAASVVAGAAVGVLASTACGAAVGTASEVVAATLCTAAAGSPRPPPVPRSAQAPGARARPRMRGARRNSTRRGDVIMGDSRSGASDGVTLAYRPAPATGR